MSDSVKDFDALAKEERRQSIRVGGRIFPLPRIPAVASMLHTRYYYGTLVNVRREKLYQWIAVKIRHSNHSERSYSNVHLQ